MHAQAYRRCGLAAVLILGLAGGSAATIAGEGETPDGEALSEEDQALQEAFELHEEGELEAAYEAFQDLAEAGDVEAKVQLGWMYLEGHASEPDMERAAELWERAAEAGHERAGELLNAVLPGVEE